MGVGDSARHVGDQGSVDFALHQVDPMTLVGTGAIRFHAFEVSIAGLDEGGGGFEEELLDQVVLLEERLDGGVEIFLRVKDRNSGTEILPKTKQFSVELRVDAESGQLGWLGGFAGSGRVDGGQSTLTGG